MRTVATLLSCLALVACQPEGSRRQETGPGGGGTSCVSSCSVPGAKTCCGDIVRQCTDGAWQEFQNCSTSTLRCVATTATDAACVDQDSGCSAGSSRCNGNNLQACDGVAWQDVTDCSAAGMTCTSTSATSAACDNSCADLTQRCEQGNVESCSAGNWILAQDCVAAGETCMQTTATTANCGSNGCTVSEFDFTRCNGDVRERCDGTSWLPFVNCVLSGEHCVTASPTRAVCRCTPDEASCITNDRYQWCTADGTWTTDYCDYATCREFEPGVVQCVLECRTTGEWCQGTRRLRCTEGYEEFIEDCAPNPCYDLFTGGTSCTPESCSPTQEGTTRCNSSGTHIETCTAGSWQATTSCMDSMQVCTESTPGAAACETSTSCSTSIDCMILGLFTGQTFECRDLTCVEVGALHDPCTIDQDCAMEMFALVCSASSICLKADNATCELDSDCSSGSCIPVGTEQRCASAG